MESNSKLIQVRSTLKLGQSLNHRRMEFNLSGYGECLWIAITNFPGCGPL